MIPLGKGQRELIIGDRQTGKTTIATDTVINQRGQGVICVYCWIGGAYNAMVKVIETLRGKKAFDYTVFLAAPASATPTEQYIAPYSAAAIGEYFMGQGKDVLVIFDNLTIHAWIYRQISLILQRSPGREAYPGDIFFVHSQLLERAGRLDPSRGGSMSFLPIVDTLQGDITGYIQTNLISITDGQIFTSSTLFNEGFKPAIDIGYSVSRIGSKVQSKGIRRVSSKLRMEYTQFRELEKLTKLRTKVSAEMAAKISHGTALVELLIQPAGAPVPEAVMIMVFFAYNKGFLDNMDKEALGVFQREAAGVFAKKYPEEYAELEKKRELSADISGKLDEILGPFCAEIMTERNR
jgi:F-type H+-transporting ATPase subunit alpha